MAPPRGAPENPMSAQCPQTVPRRPAKGGEGRRKLTVRLTCDFTLTWALGRAECEAECEPGTALITQRSQVQILPPLQRKIAGQRRFRRDLGPPLVCFSLDVSSDVREWTLHWVEI